MADRIEKSCPHLFCGSGWGERGGKTIDPCVFFFSSRRRHTRLVSDWSSDVCSSDLDDGRLDVKFQPAANNCSGLVPVPGTPGGENLTSKRPSSLREMPPRRPPEV